MESFTNGWLQVQVIDMESFTVEHRLYFLLSGELSIRYIRTAGSPSCLLCFDIGELSDRIDMESFTSGWLQVQMIDMESFTTLLCFDVGELSDKIDMESFTNGWLQVQVIDMESFTVEHRLYFLLSGELSVPTTHQDLLRSSETMRFNHSRNVQF